ncbi:MAG TPA: hypothetical protein VGC08_08005 [Pedobacter sp.]
MRKIKDVIITVSPAAGNVNTTSHLVVLKQAGSFEIEVTEEEVYDPNEIIVVAKRTHVKGKKPADSQPKAAPVPEFDWIWSTMIKPSFQSSDKNATLRGNKFSLRYPRVLEGGGLAWLEPFVPGYEPTTKIPNGYFITAKGEPKILSAVWREYSAKNDGKIINGSTKQFRDSVQLHVYTQGLYGHDIEVTLMDHDYTPGDSDDTLNVYSKDSVASPIAYFTTEVRVYAMLDDENSISPVVSDSLAGEKSESGSQVNPAKLYIQKTVIDVYIDKLWINDGGSSLEIYPKVRLIGNAQETALKDVYIKVKGEAQKDSALSMTGNKPVVVDEIPTEMASYAPCKYTAVILRIPEKDEVKGKDIVKSIYLYKQGDPSHRNLRHFEVVTGESKKLKQITIELEEVQTLDSDCSKPAGQKHKGHVLRISSFPETVGDANNPKAAPKEDKSKWSAPPFKYGGGLLNATAKAEHNITKDFKLEVLSNTDSKIEFNARYIYDKSPIFITNLAVHWIFRYFWIGKNVVGKPYIINASTCRHEQQVMIYPYPDVAWELALEFTNNKVKKTAISSATYRQTAEEKKHKWTVDGDKELSLAVHAKWDDGEKLDLTENLSESIEKKVKKFTAIGDLIKSLFLGEHNGTNPSTTRPSSAAQQRLAEAQRKFTSDQKKKEQQEKDATKMKDLMDRTRAKLLNNDKDSRAYKDADKQMGYLQKRMDNKLPSLKREVVGFEVEWPSLNFTFGWSRVNTNSQQRDDLQNQTGVLLTGSIEAKPLIGLSAYLDFLALVQRAHPVALAVIAAVDLSLSLIGDGSKIVCELRATGTLGGKLEGFLNTLTKENSFNKKDVDANGKPIATITGDLEFSLLIQIKIEVRKDYVFVSVQGGLDAKIEAKAKWSARAILDYDDKGFFTRFFGTFEGLEVIGKATITANVKGKKTEPATPGGEAGKAPGLLNVNGEASIKYQAIDKQEEKELGTMHFGNG